MSANLETSPLDGFALIAVRGPDARKFLHGQLSQEVLGLSPDRVALAGFHNPQGRALAIMRLVPLADDALLLALPAEIAGTVTVRLRRFVLRARLAIEDVSAQWQRVGLSGPAAAGALAAAGLAVDAPVVGALARAPGRLAWRHALAPERFIVLAEAAVGLPAGWPAPQAEAARDWQAADVAAGLPQVHAATSEAFVAQMLNLDALEGVSFTKGCYTGQEVIARAHFRGQVKRRMQRFFTSSDASLVPGAKIRLQDGRTAQVVMSARPQFDGREFLAVAPLPGAIAGAAEDAGPQDVALITASTLPLPYSLAD